MSRVGLIEVSTQFSWPKTWLQLDQDSFPSCPTETSNIFTWIKSVDQVRELAQTWLHPMLALRLVFNPYCACYPPLFIINLSHHCGVYETTSVLDLLLMKSCRIPPLNKPRVFAMLWYACWSCILNRIKSILILPLISYSIKEGFYFPSFT